MAKTLFLQGTQKNIITKHLKTNKMKQTAVEWLEFRYKNNINLNQSDFEEAKEMEKQQICGGEEVESLIRTTYEETMRGMVEWFANNKDKDPMDAESAIDNYIYPMLAERGIIFKK